MGPLAETAIAIDQSGLDLNLVIVTGRNVHLKNYLETLPWENPTFIYGFTHEMPDFMQAADAIVTKAGPGTIAEALVAGLPIILYARLPGQEDGNVTYVEKTGVGVWAPDPLKVVRTLTRWVCRPAERARVARGLSPCRPPTGCTGDSQGTGSEDWADGSPGKGSLNQVEAVSHAQAK